MSGLFRKKRRFNEERPQAPIPAPLATPAQSEVPAPLPVLERPVAVDSAPIPAPVAPAASPWPAGAYEFQPGVWYVIHGTTNAGPFSRPEEYEEWVDAVKRRDKSAHEADRIIANTRYNGPVPAGSLSPRDAGYLYHRSHDYRLVKHNGSLFHEVLSGSHNEVANAIQLGDITNPSMGPMDPDNPELVGLVNNLFAAAR